MPVDGIVQVRLADGTVTTLQRVTRDFKDATAFTMNTRAGSGGAFSPSA
jgi:hypothetical protein